LLGILEKSMRIKAPKIVILSAVLLLTVHIAALWPAIFWAQDSGIPMQFMYIAIAGLCALLVIWLYFIVIGKSWARITYTIFFLLGFFGAVGRLPEFDLFTYILWAIRAAAVILLYVPISNSWFMQYSPDKPSVPNFES